MRYSLASCAPSDAKCAHTCTRPSRVRRVMARSTVFFEHWAMSASSSFVSSAPPAAAIIPSTRICAALRRSFFRAAPASVALATPADAASCLDDWLLLVVTQSDSAHAASSEYATFAPLWFCSPVADDELPRAWPLLSDPPPAGYFAGFRHQSGSALIADLLIVLRHGCAPPCERGHVVPSFASYT